MFLFQITFFVHYSGLNYIKYEKSVCQSLMKNMESNQPKASDMFTAKQQFW